MKKLYYLNFILVLLATCFLPKFAFSTFHDTNIAKPYITVNYQPTVSNFRNFHIKETNFDTKKPIEVNINSTGISTRYFKNREFAFYSSHNKHYESYKNDLSAFTTSIGISLKNFKIEAEGSYKVFDVFDFRNYAIQGAHNIFALPRETNSYGMYPLDRPSLRNKNTGYTILKNNGIAIISNMINLCYEKQSNNFTPYICFGIGGDFIEIFDTTRIKAAYQGKIGISYPLTSRTNLLISGQYHKVIGNQFKELPTLQIVELKRLPERQPEYDITALLTLDIEYFSGEVGLSFTL
nr:map1-11 [uncultured Ehrlichia sp.]